MESKKRDMEEKSVVNRGWRERMAAAWQFSRVASPKARRFAVWGAGVLVALALFGFFAVPPILRPLLERELGAALHRPASVAGVSFNPLTLRLEVRGLSVKSPAGDEQAGFDSLTVNVSSGSLLRGAFVLDAVRLQTPRVSVTRLADGRYDISDLLEEWLKPNDKPSAMPRFLVNHVEIRDGRLRFDDQPKGVVHTVEALQFSLPFVSSLASQADQPVKPTFSAMVDGSQLNWSGDGKPFSATRASQLKLDLADVDLAEIQPYLPESLPLRLDKGRLSASLAADFSEVAPEKYSWVIDGKVRVADLALNDKARQALLAWRSLELALDRIDPINRSFALGDIVLEGPVVSVEIDRQGEMNWLRVADQLAGTPGAMEKSDAGANVEAKPAADSAPAKWSVADVSIRDGKLLWRDASKGKPTSITVDGLAVHAARLESQQPGKLEIAEVALSLNAGDPLQLKELAVKGVQVDSDARRVEIAELVSQSARVAVLRDRTGQVEWFPLPALKQGASAKASKENAVQSAAPWRVSLKTLGLKGLGLRYRDATLERPDVLAVDNLSVQGEGLGNEPGKKGTLAIKGEVNRQGRLDIAGSVQADPPEADLKVEAVGLPVMALQPYFADYLKVTVTRGQLSGKGRATFQLAARQPKASYAGSLTLGDFLAIDQTNSTDFLKWKSLYFGGIDFRLDPMALSVGEIALTNFYSRLILNSQGRLNLADIIRQPEATAAIGKTADAATSNATNDATNAATNAATTQGAQKIAEAPPAKPIPIRIDKVTLQGGTVNYSDEFVKPRYSANVTHLAGRVSGLSSAANTVADMDLRGRYANSSPVRIYGTLNPLAPQAFVDIKGEVKDVDLVGLSSYSGKYAGYAIEKGKLSMDVAYKLENRQLTAANHLFLDQFTFGDKVESPDATTLPVRLAISLLKNNRGEIDINLPISGSLDDPQFSVGGLIVRVIVNLFVKAATSPFALLGSMFSGGEELSNVVFPTGLASLEPAAVGRLEALAKALRERNALNLEITGVADLEKDRDGLRRAGVTRAAKAEKLKEMLRSGKEGVPVDEVKLGADEYAVYLTRAYKQAKFPKPRNLVGLQKDLPVPEMERLMLINVPVSDDDVRGLAMRRAETVQSWLLEQGQVPADRLFLLPPKVVANQDGANSALGPARVDFSLK